MEIIIISPVYSKGKGKGKVINPITFGINQPGDKSGLKPGIHAEQDAILNLPNIRCRNKNPIPIEILVIRVSIYGKIQSSRPCYHCVQKMKKIPIKKGYIIRHVYYSNEAGEIDCETLEQLENGENHISRYYKRIAESRPVSYIVSN